MMMRLMPPIWTMVMLPKMGSRLRLPPRATIIAPMAMAITKARLTVARLHPLYAVDGSLSIRLLLGNATAAARRAIRAGMMKRMKLASIAMVTP